VFGFCCSFVDIFLDFGQTDAPELTVGGCNPLKRQWLCGEALAEEMLLPGRWRGGMAR
jgi:hypothetical protein